MSEEIMDMNSIKINRVKKNQKVKGTVIDVTDKEIHVDLQTFTEGTMYLNHYTLDKNVNSFKELVKVGDEVEAKVIKVSEEDESGLILLDRLSILREAKFTELVEVFNNEENINVSVQGKVKGGYQVQYNGVRLFLPNSQVASNVKTGDTLLVKILELDERRHSGVVSRKIIEHAEYIAKRQEEFDAIEEGQTLKGVVSKIEVYGVFVKFEFNQGLIRLKELDHLFVKDPNDIVSVGDEIEVKVLSKYKNKLTLSRKALLLTVYEVYEKEHAVGDTVVATVAKKLPEIGIILNLAEHVTGLLHKSEFSWNPDDNLMNNVKIGDEIEVKILNINTEKEKIALSRKALIDNPWNRVNCKIGDEIEGVITEISSKGLAVEALGVDGFIDTRDALTDGNSAKLEDYYAVGDTVKGLVREINSKRWILNIDMKALKEQQSRAEFEKFSSPDEEKISLGDQFKDFFNDEKN